jgi:hypothetical protein
MGARPRGFGDRFGIRRWRNRLHVPSVSLDTGDAAAPPNQRKGRAAVSASLTAALCSSQNQSVGIIVALRHGERKLQSFIPREFLCSRTLWSPIHETRKTHQDHHRC